MSKAEWQYRTKKRGQALGQRVKGLQYFEFRNDGKFYQIGEIQGEGTTFLENRKKYDAETKLLDTIFPFVAYFTAPSSDDANGVIDDVYKAHTMAVDEILFLAGVDAYHPNLSLKARLKNVDRFYEQFKIVAGEIEKACNKIVK